MKKILGLSTLALASVLAFTGCSKDKAELDIEKTNTVINEMQNYLNEQKELSASEMAQLFSKRMTNLVVVSMDDNYKLKIAKRVTRVEYSSDNVTKVYHYTLGENGAKSKEVYREIYKDYVYTYVKDLNVYSKVPLSNARSEESFLEFHRDDDVVIWDEDNQRKVYWEDVESDLNIHYNSDVYSMLYDMANFTENDAATKAFFSDTSYSKENDKDIFTMNYTDFYNGDENDDERLDIYKNVIEITNTSYKSTNVRSYVREGVPGSRVTEESVTELTFDKEYTINFDTTGYQLADDYYNN